MTNSRRQFLRNISLAAGSVVVAGEVFGKANASVAPLENAVNEEGLKLGVAGYSFVHFNLEESLKMMKRMDIHYLCIKDFHLPFDSSAEQIKTFHETLAKSNVKGYAVGPIYMKTKEDIDKAFDYAKRVGVDLIVGIPEPDVLSYVAEKCKEYNIKYGIHNHGPEDKLYPNASVIYNYIKNLDSRLGMCFDMGHNMRDQHDPIKDLIRYKDRIFDLHLKNVTMADAKGTTCELGRGVIDIPAFVKALKKIKYTGVCSLEFEKDMKDPLAGIAESAGYFKGVTATLGIKVL